MPWRSPRSPFRTSSIIGSAMDRPRFAVTAHFHRRVMPARSRSGLRHSSKSCNFRVKDDFARMGWCSPRAASMRSARGAPPRLIAAGLVLPLASPIDFRRSGSKSRCPRDAPQHPPCPGPFRSPRVTVERRPSRNSWSALGAEDSITKGERANTLLQPIGSEATSEAGSFRRRAPVAA